MSAMEELVRQAMGSGAHAFVEKALVRREVSMDTPMSEVFGDFPAEFLKIRTDLVDAVTVEILEALSGDA